MFWGGREDFSVANPLLKEFEPLLGRRELQHGFVDLFVVLVSLSDWNG